jgi:hypothetical protein
VAYVRYCPESGHSFYPCGLFGGSLCASSGHSSSTQLAHLVGDNADVLNLKHVFYEGTLDRPERRFFAHPPAIAFAYSTKV